MHKIDHYYNCIKSNNNLNQNELLGNFKPIQV